MEGSYSSAALGRVRVVMVGTTDSGNIGAAARAMKVMGLSQLHLVRPQNFPSARATARAAGADDLLARAKICDSLDVAVADCTMVFATSARSRKAPWRVLSPAMAAAEIASNSGSSALVFGPEHSGLANADLDLSHALVRIPAVADFSSLNVAAAVQILCYELALAIVGSPQPESGSGSTVPASMDELEAFYQHLEQSLHHIGFMRTGEGGSLMRRMRVLFARAMPDANELRMLRGVLSAILKLPPS